MPLDCSLRAECCLLDRLEFLHLEWNQRTRTAQRRKQLAVGLAATRAHKRRPRDLLEAPSWWCVSRDPQKMLAQTSCRT